MIAANAGSRPSAEAGVSTLKWSRKKTPESTAVDKDEQLVHAWRAGQLKQLGVPGSMAEAVADRLDWHQVAALVSRGCPPVLALRIVG
jgi:hypothetical protein